MQTFRLGDGRQLVWREFGDRRGAPVVAVHGSPDSSAIWTLLDAQATQCGVRLVAPDRPGFGASTPQPGRSIVDWVADLDELTGHLDLGRYGLLAVSGGSPYALAVASAHPDRVDHLGLLSVISPLDVPGVTQGANRQVRFTFWAARRAPALLRPMARTMVRLVERSPQRAAERLIAMRPPDDRAIIRRPEVMAVLEENLPNQFRHADSIAGEMHNAARPWGFDLADVVVSTTVWQGGRDDVHTPAMGRYLADHLPNAELWFEPDAATFDLLLRADPMLGRFTAT